ncbi:MAG: nitrate reductase molybdenum cofactor assembly chaperone [Desulfobacterales bacterium]
MTESQAESLRLLSALLLYPDDAFLQDLDAVESAAGKLHSAEMTTAIDAFLRYLKTHSPIQLQECYTAVFDMNPSTTLNLTHHIYGDNAKRAAALAHLQQIYEAAGWERITGELPDFLPLMLEFLATAPDADNGDLIWLCLRGLEGCLAGLRQTAPAYAALLQPLVDMAAAQPGSDGRQGHLPE